MSLGAYIGRSLLALPFVATLWACQLAEQKTGTQELSLSLDSIVKVERFYPSESEDTLAANFRFKYIYYQGADSLNYAINRAFFGEDCGQYAPQELVEAYYQKYVRQRSTVIGGEQDTLSSQPSDYNLSLKEEHRFGDILSLSCQELEANGGEAEQFPSVSLSSFSLRSKSKISESDLFVDDYTEALAQVIQMRLMQEHKVHKLEDLADEGFFAPREISPNGNFMITPSGVRYAYPPQEIAPYSWGTIYVDLTWDDMAHLIRSGSLVERYI